MLLKKCPYRIKSVLLCATLVLLNSSWMSSCAVLTESQIESVNNLAVVSDTIAVSPSILFKELSNIRLERGLYYAASLTSAETRFNEINALAQGNLDDKKLAALGLTPAAISAVMSAVLRAGFTAEDRRRTRAGRD